MPADYVTTVRLEYYDLATIARYFTENGEFRKVKSSSAIVRNALETLVDFLVQQELVERFENPEEAFEFLDSLGIITKTGRERGGPGFVRNVSQYDSREEIRDKSLRGYGETRKTLSDAPKNSNPWEKGGRTYKIMEEVKKEYKQKEETSNFSEEEKQKRFTEERLRNYIPNPSLERIAAREMVKMYNSLKEQREIKDRENKIETIEEANSRRKKEDQFERWANKNKMNPTKLEELQMELEKEALLQNESIEANESIEGSGQESETSDKD